jgi:hypothetical protein
VVALHLSSLGNREGSKKDTDEQKEKQALTNNLQLGFEHIQPKRAVTPQVLVVHLGCWGYRGWLHYTPHHNEREKEGRKKQMNKERNRL